jgi:hypothetical protein
LKNKIGLFIAVFIFFAIGNEIYTQITKKPKSAKSKLYAGYIEAIFKVHNKVIYLIQIDFMSLKGEDIPQRISCIINSVMTLKE